jgi:hypothetical protein
MLIYQQKRLNENEKKLVMHWLKFEKLKGLFNLWKVVLNIKNSVLETMRNYTNLSTKDIRLSMKRFKDLYEVLKQHGL